jgi:hypothetical protein
MATVIDFPEAARVTEQALTWPERARGAAVVDAESYGRASELLKGIKALRQEIADTFDPHVKRAHDAHRALLKEKADAEAPLTEAERIIKAALVAYNTEQERLRRIEQERLEREAKAKADEEALARAAAMEQEGRDFGDPALVEEAHQLLTEQLAAPPPPVAVARTTPTVAGIVHRTTWSARVVDLIALVKFVAANPSHIGLLQANQAALNAQARSLKAAMRLPGVQAVPTQDVAAGR